MNEQRIRELLAEALDNDTIIASRTFGHWPLYDEDLAKFAELIVKECEKVISDGRYSDMACEGNSHRVSYNNGRSGAVSDIKKHFGIEQ